MRHHIATRLLTAMGELAARGEDCGTVERLAEMAGLTGAQVSDACQVLRRNGLARHVRHHCYALTEAGLKAAADGVDVFRGPRQPIGPTAPRHDSLMQRAWAAMRAMRKFDLAKLTVMASRDERWAYKAITQYCAVLRETGYLIRIDAQGSTRGRRGASSRYVLMRDSGPFAPRWRKRNGEVFDPNNHMVYPIKPEGVE